MPKVVISGAGIGGLTSALALMKLGFEVQVFEQAPELGEVGAGLQIAPNGSRILMALGLADQLETVVCEADYKEVRLWNTGERRRLFDLGEDCRKRFGAPYWFVHRADLHCMLVEAINALAPDAILTGRTGVSCRETAKGVELHFQDGSSASGDVLIGADGVHSRLRGTMFDSPRAEFTGMMSWRGIARMADLPDDLRGHVGTNWVGPGGHVVTYPLRCGEIMNFAGIVERSDWTVESWSTRGTKEECARDFANWHPSIHHMIGVLDRTFKWALLGREPLKSWSRGRVALLGDAAHPTLPFLAHGAIMALEDAAVLARCLKETPERPQIALKRYEATRIGRATAIVNGSAENGKRFHNPLLADPSAARAYLDEQWDSERVRQRYDWLFEYDANTVPLADIQAEVL